MKSNFFERGEKTKVNKSAEMYLDSKLAEGFAKKEKEDTEEHSVVSGIIDSKVLKLFGNKEIKMVNLGAGANPQKYEGIMKKLKEGSKLDWVDISPKMLELASGEADQINVGKNIKFIESNFMNYLNSQEDNSLDCVMMQYAINYIDDLKIFFEALSKKLKENGAFIANLGIKSLKNNPHVSFLVNDKEISGKQDLVDGDKYTINFLNEDGTIFASTEKNFFSNELIKSTSESFNLKPEIVDEKGFEMLTITK